jgi:aryl-alcohol dehydrogenase-like predicted oxidoreductase
VKYRTIGTDPKTRRQVSVLSLGTMHLGTATDEATSFAILDRYVAKDAGATVNQVVLAWLIGGQIPVIPLVGASSVAQLDESLAAVDLELTTEQRATLDAAG